jgi:integrase/recombinase XerD
MREFKIYLQFERGLSQNTIASYLNDIKKYMSYLNSIGIESVEFAGKNELEGYIHKLSTDKISKRTQSRTISSLKCFYGFLESERRIESNPCDILETPKLPRYLPDVLSVEEVLKVINTVDLSSEEGERNKAIIEMLYSCGLRVSELCNLKISDLYLKDGFIRVMGKGSKQRLIPIGEPAIKAITTYIQIRRTKPIKYGYDDILFLNRRGGQLTRNMIFIIIKKLAQNAGITKSISPHTFRHSFATHLVENGADLRVVQQMLGHESILTTEIYTHIDSQKWQNTILKYHPERERL